MLGSSPLGASTSGSCTSAPPMPVQERTKGGDPAPVVPIDGAITTNITRAITARDATATIRCAIQPKITSQSWAVGWTTGGHHSIHGGQTKKNPCNKRRKGQPVVEPLIWGTADLTISDRPTTPYHRADPPSPTSDTANANPNGLGSSSPPWMSPLGNRVIHRVIQLPTSTRTQPTVGHSGVVTDACSSDSMVRRVRFRH
jgi:hypothetical protein